MAANEDSKRAVDQPLGAGDATTESTEAHVHTELDTTSTSEYTSSDLEVLEGLEGVRLRPSMYIGDPNTRGLHQLFNEVVDNAVDEALAGRCDEIGVALISERTVAVADNGAGFPVDKHEKTGLSGLETVMTLLHAGGKFGGGGYKVSSGLHGVGVSVVNALSSHLEVLVCRDGKKYRQAYEYGKTASPLETLGKCDDHGSTVTWEADDSIFKEHVYDPHIMLARIRDLAYLNPNLTFVWQDKWHGGEPEAIRYKRGIIELVEHLNDGKEPLHKVVYFSRSRDDMEVEVALQYHDSYSDLIMTFANNIHTTEGGTHLSGFKTALTRVINAYARKTGILKDRDPNLSGDDVRDGLTAVLSIKLVSPQFEAQTKIKLTNFEVEGLVNSIVGESFGEFLDENPAVGRRIVDKALVARRAREAARKSAELVRRQGGLEHIGMPGLLTDCIERDPSVCELFLVEGRSAAGPAKEGRDRRTQALLPLRGKILNVERARIDRALQNAEIRSLITVLGAGFSMGSEGSDDEHSNGNGNGSFDKSKLRYHKIIIMTDADVDGGHIRTLLLTFFYRYMKPLVKEGHVYIAQPPLFSIKAGKDERYYAQSEDERDKIIEGLRGRNRSFTISRFKGLGEMNGDQLFETTMNPETRNLVKVVYDPDLDEDIEQMFSKLMGDKVEPRRAFIEQHAKEVTDLDWEY